MTDWNAEPDSLPKLVLGNESGEQVDIRRIEDRGHHGERCSPRLLIVLLLYVLLLGLVLPACYPVREVLMLLHVVSGYGLVSVHLCKILLQAATGCILVVLCLMFILLQAAPASLALWGGASWLMAFTAHFLGIWHCVCMCVCACACVCVPVIATLSLRHKASRLVVVARRKCHHVGLNV